MCVLHLQDYKMWTNTLKVYVCLRVRKLLLNILQVWMNGALKRWLFKNCMQHYADSSKIYLYVCVIICVIVVAAAVESLFEYLTIKVIIQSTCELK